MVATLGVVPVLRPLTAATLAVISLLLSLTAGGLEAQTPRPMTVDDELDMVQVGDALLSPDGQRVFFSEQRLDWGENTYEKTYHMAPAAGGEAFRWLGEEGGSDFQFSPDGRFFSFKRTVDKKQQVFSMRTTGGEAVQLTEHDTSVRTYQWSDDGTQLFFTAEDAVPDSVEKEVENGADAIWVDEGANGKTRSNWRNLWVFDVAAKSERALTQDSILIGSFDVSPDGRRVAYTARRSNRENDDYLSEIHVLDVASGTVRQVTTNQAPEGGLEWAPDSRRLLFTAADDREWMNRNTKLWVMDVDAGTHRLVSGGFEGSPSNVVWTPDGRALLFSGQQGVATNLYRLDVDSGSLTKLTDRTGTLRAGSWSKDRTRWLASYSDYRTPPDLWVGTVQGRSEPVRITHANPQIANLQLADMEVVRWRSTDGTEIEGLLHLPAGRSDGERVPLMLNIHGGPAGVFPNAWSARYHIYGGLGYASLSPNVRGSSGYTDALREGNTVQQGDGIGKGDYQDLQTGVDAMIERGIADPEHLALRGWSYGGILGGWTITQTDRFKAASIGAGVYDWTSEYGPGFNHDVRLWHIGGTPWENPDGWRGQSALTHVANVSTPTILLHGEEDTTDTEQQSMMFFVGIRDVGKAPVRYIKFPREPHGFREPRHQRTRDVEEIRWMQRYVLGEEWTPWTRPPEKKETPVS
ncbi:MAG: S9 family peptidase [Gemmatimonadetes bacterium]|nr:S9 family peptidase [Gemmatimonadota bacterium]